LRTATPFHLQSPMVATQELLGFAFQEFMHSETVLRKLASDAPRSENLS
jgi:hypothetical protein